jgi:CRISPR-associated endonuclease Cas1
MASSKNLTQVSQYHNRVVSRHGVVVLFGYPIEVFVERGHLILKDGIGPDRRHFRFSRVNHGLKRLVVIGSDGFISLAGLRWLSDQKASFVLLERDGRVLATTGPVRPSDARLRRAQALAASSGAALRIARELVRQKIAGQASVARYKLLDTTTADTIDRFTSELPCANDIRDIRAIESRAAYTYWSAWRALPVNFPKKDLPKIPEHWRSFGTRISPLTGSPRLAVTPACAMMNYLYALVESEAGLAARALGLDAAMGLFHVDRPNRESFSCDLMEPVRPTVDSYLLDWITTQPLKREWFFEQPNGNARLMASLTQRLSETASIWARTVGPVAEWVAQELWDSTKKPEPAEQSLPTRLTHRRRTEGRGREYIPSAAAAPAPPKVCPGCGVTTHEGRLCPTCGRKVSGEKLIELAKRGRVVARNQVSQAKRSTSQTRHEAAKRAWRSMPKPAWLDEKTYMSEIRPRLSSVTISALSLALGVCESYAADIRAGRRHPHPRHWQALARLVNAGPQ